MFPSGVPDDLEAIYAASPAARVHNALLAAAVADEVGRRPAHTAIRVLEIGGGTGSTTTHVLPVLPADRTHYRFTDVSSFFVSAATRRFGGRRWIQAQVLDIERDPSAQGVEPVNSSTS